MSNFKKQLLFILLALAIITSGALVIYSATPQGKLKIKPSLTAKVKMVNQENATTGSNNPVGWWKMDEGTGQYVYDVSGNGNTGTLGTSTAAEPADPTWATGKLGKGISFDGTNDSVVIAGSATNHTISTISAWIKPAYATSGIFYDDPFSWSASYDNGGPSMRIESGKVIITGGWSGTSYNGVSSINDLTVGRWYHIVGTFNSVSGLVQLYIDGVFQGNNGTTYCHTTTINNSTVGNRPAKSKPFNGIIDDVRIYNRALTAGEVGQMYNSTKDGYLGKIKVSTGLVGYWKLDDNNALTSVIDYSGKGNTGTAYSGTATSTSVLSTSTAMIGRAMSFDGVGDYIAGTSNFSTLTGAYTVSAWVNLPSGITSYHYLITLGNGNYPSFSPVFSTVGVFRPLVYLNSTNYRYGITDMRGTGWRHITFVVTGSQQLDINNAKIYIDGREETSYGALTNSSSPVLPSNNFQIGKRSTYYFNGLIDEVKIWNYARSAEQILQDYQRGLKGLP